MERITQRTFKNENNENPHNEKPHNENPVYDKDASSLTKRRITCWRFQNFPFLTTFENA